MEFVVGREATQKEIGLLPPPHATFEEHLAKYGQQGRQPAVNGLGPIERDRREMAARNAFSRPVAASHGTSKGNLIQRLLRLSANSPEVMAKVIGTMSADEAVAAAEQAQDGAVRDALVLHAVQTMR